jgi:hypothetical protein
MTKAEYRGPTTASGSSSRPRSQMATRRLAAAGGVAAALLLLSHPASAGVYTDDLSRCLVKSSSQADKELLVQWIFSAISLHPAVKPYATITADQRDDLDRKLAVVIQRLVLTDCRSQTLDAIKYEGDATLGASFQVLGQVAARSLFSDPNVAHGLNGLEKYFDEKKLDELTKGTK